MGKSASYENLLKQKNTTGSEKLSGYNAELLDEIHGEEREKIEKLIWDAFYNRKDMDIAVLFPKLKTYDGMQALKPKEVEGIVIAGMGGNLMKRILMQGEQVAHTAKELILQPQSEVMEFRKFLWESGYTIVAEDMVLEDGKYYPMMRVVYENAQKEIPDVLALKYGEKLLEQKHPVLKQYLLWQKMQKEKILGNLQKNAKKDVSSRKEEIEEELSYIAHALEKIDGAK